MNLLEQCQKWNETDEFQKTIDALEALPAGERTPEMDSELARAYNGLALPLFEKNFRKRTEEAWTAFAEIEEELRQIMDTDRLRERGGELIEKCSSALELAFHSPAFELGVHGGQYELILSAEGNRAKLFPLVYFQRHAPESVLAHWNILAGRQISEGFSLRAGEIQVQADDVQVWAERTEEGISLTMFCGKLLPLLKDEEDKLWWLFYTLTVQVLGEVPVIAYVSRLELAEQPKEGAPLMLSDLPKALREMGYELWDDAGSYLDNSYMNYELEPEEDPEADWRMDVFTGSARLPVLINEYMCGERGTMDDYHKDGIAAGFLCYPLDGFEGEEQAAGILKFRDDLREAIREHAGDDAAVFLGGATGLYYGYLDFIAWDLPAVLDAARDFFAGTDISWGGFRVFRRNVGVVRLWEQESEPQVDPETGSLLSKKDMETLASFEDGVSGHFK